MKKTTDGAGCHRPVAPLRRRPNAAQRHGGSCYARACLNAGAALSRCSTRGCRRGRCLARRAGAYARAPAIRGPPGAMTPLPIAWSCLRATAAGTHNPLQPAPDLGHDAAQKAAPAGRSHQAGDAGGRRGREDRSGHAVSHGCVARADTRVGGAARRTLRPSSVARAAYHATQGPRDLPAHRTHAPRACAGALPAAAVQQSGRAGAAARRQQRDAQPPVSSAARPLPCGSGATSSLPRKTALPQRARVHGASPLRPCTW